MNTLVRVLAVAGLAVVCSGCSITHVIAEDYSQYLQNNAGIPSLPHIDQAAAYRLTPATASHHYEFRAVVTGYAHLRVVDFGDILEKTLQSTDVQNAFQSLSKAQGEGTPGALLLKFNLVSYQFEESEARVKLQITAIRDGAVIVDETYFEHGVSQGGKMFWGGPFGMRNAIQQSTKDAIDKILYRAISDIKATTSGRA